MENLSGLERVDDGIWATRGDLRLMPGMYFPVTSHIIRLSSGGLLIHSPIEFSDEVLAAIRRLGDVEFILAPSLYHVTYFKKAKEQFPDAEMLGPKGLDTKVSDVSYREIISTAPSETLGTDFEHVFVGGAPKFNELVLRHRATNSLIVADYFFNIVETRGFLTRPVLKFASDALGKPTQSKLWRKVTEDKAAARKSAEDVLRLDFGRILVGHGRPIDEGRKVAESSLAWLF